MRDIFTSLNFDFSFLYSLFDRIYMFFGYFAQYAKTPISELCYDGSFLVYIPQYFSRIINGEAGGGFQVLTTYFWTPGGIPIARELPLLFDTVVTPLVNLTISLIGDVPLFLGLPFMILFCTVVAGAIKFIIDLIF